MKPIYVIYDGKTPGVYISYEQVATQKIEAKNTGGLSWKKYVVIDEALAQARKILGLNYYIEPAAKEYIQMHKKAKNKTPINMPSRSIKEEDSSSQKPTYKECLVKGLEPLDTKYINTKIEEEFQKISPQWKNDIKEDIMKEIRIEMQQQFDIIRKEYEDQYIFPKIDAMDMSVDDQSLDPRGHGQLPE